jgi:hypothetical protein
MRWRWMRNVYAACTGAGQPLLKTVDDVRCLLDLSDMMSRDGMLYQQRSIT